MKNKLLLFTVFCLFTCKMVCSPSSMDSLENIFHSDLDLLEKTEVLLDFYEKIPDDELKRFQAWLEQLLLNADESLQAKTNLLFMLGEIHYKKMAYRDAIDYYKKLQLLYNELNDHNKQAENYFNLGICYEEFGDNEESLNNYLHAFKLFEDLNKKERVGVTLRCISALYANWGEYDKSLEYLNRAKKIFEDLGLSVELADANIQLGNIFLNSKSYDKAIKAYRSSLEVYHSIDDTYRLASCCSNIGLVYDYLHQYNEALIYYKKALLLFEEIEYNRDVGTILFNIGVSYHNLGYYNNEKRYYYEALNYYNKALKESKKSGYIGLLIEVCDGMHNTYEMLGNYEKSLECYKRYAVLKDSIFNEKKYAKTLEMEERLQRENRTIEKEFEDKIVVLEKNNELRLRILLGINIFTLLFLSYVIYKYFKLRERIKA